MMYPLYESQKAPSTTRCIKTYSNQPERRNVVRKHLAPEGTLRPDAGDVEDDLVCTRKHPAPEGALRLICPISYVGD